MAQLLYPGHLALSGLPWRIPVAVVAHQGVQVAEVAPLVVMVGLLLVAVGVGVDPLPVVGEGVEGEVVLLPSLVVEAVGVVRLPSLEVEAVAVEVVVHQSQVVVEVVGRLQTVVVEEVAEEVVAVPLQETYQVAEVEAVVAGEAVLKPFLEERHLLVAYYEVMV